MSAVQVRSTRVLVETLIVAAGVDRFALGFGAIFVSDLRLTTSPQAEGDLVRLGSTSSQCLASLDLPLA